jgi:hypothetical protein
MNVIGELVDLTTDQNKEEMNDFATEDLKEIYYHSQVHFNKKNFYKVN